MNIDVVDESGADWVDTGRLVDLASHLLLALRLDPECGVSLALVDEDAMTELHLRWMDEPGPTDVMSFPMDELRPGEVGQPRPLGMLGDIVICPSVAERQALAGGHEPAAEMELLLAHGMLHLLGYDHAETEEHRVMFALQDDLLAQWRRGDRMAIADDAHAVESAPVTPESRDSLP